MNKPSACHRPASAAFTLIELLTVIAIIGILAAILIPVVGAVRESARGATCASNVRQMLSGLHMYGEDNGGLLPPPQIGSLEDGPFGIPRGQNTWHAYISEYCGIEDAAAAHRDRTFHWTSDTTELTVFNCPTTVNTIVPLPGKESTSRLTPHYSYGLNADVPVEFHRNSPGDAGRRSGKTIYLHQLEMPTATMAILETSDWSAMHEREMGNGYAMIPHGEGQNVGFYDGSVRRISGIELMGIEADDVFWRGRER